MPRGFAVWITGLPASGKSTLAAVLAREISAREMEVEVLESDALRGVLTPCPDYTEDEREKFYRAMVHMGCLLSRHGVAVIFDATANRRRYRDLARRQIDRFMEVFVDCPPGICAARDPKGLYRQAQAGKISSLPGLQAPYEAPEDPEITVRGDGEEPAAAARRVIARLCELGYLEE
ncbi:MAG: adenylyl-sulfate kinase [Acidobacteria bacterium]|nr:adenylyl-sulfate kinase [Acidobacteriota bacterium]